MAEDFLMQLSSGHVGVVHEQAEQPLMASNDQLNATFLVLRPGSDATVDEGKMMKRKEGLFTRVNPA